MSRNVRQNFSRLPSKVTKRRDSDSSSPNLSDDDGYSAVEAISDSEDDDEDNVDAAEEEHIINHELRDSYSSSSPRPRSSGDEEEVDDDASEEDDAGNADADVDDSTSWNGFVSEGDENSSPDTPQQDTTQVQRHVRFADVPSSDSDSTETEDDNADFFPDLFVDQSTLDPAFRREIEHDEDDSSNSSAFWDFHGPLYTYGIARESGIDHAGRSLSEDDTPMATPVASQDPSALVALSGDSQDLDGYECELEPRDETASSAVMLTQRSSGW
jgi:hypothetical protein